MENRLFHTSSSTIGGDNEFPNTNGFSWFPGFGGCAMLVVTVTSLRIASYGRAVVPTPIKLAFKKQAEEQRVINKILKDINKLGLEKEQ